MEQHEDFLSKIDTDLFEEHFTYWNMLPSHLKIKVLRCCSYPTLRDFMFLSKECNYLVSNMRIPVHAIALEHYPEGWYRIIFGMPDEKLDECCASVKVGYMPCMTHDGTQGEPFSHDFHFYHKKGGECTREERMRTRTKKRDLIQESYPKLYYPDSVYTASTKVFLRLAEHLNAEHVFIYLELVEGFESVLKNLPSKHLITCSSLTVKGCRFSFLKLLFPFVNRGCGLQIYPFEFGDDEEEPIDSAIFDSELQWVDGKRKINRLCLYSTLALTEDMIYKVGRCELIPESELMKTPFLKYFMEEHLKSGFRVGVRNNAGNLILVNLSETSCEIADPYSEDDPPLSHCSVDYPFDDDDD